MDVAGFFGAGLAREDFGEGRLALHQMVQAGLDGRQIVETMHALGAGAKLAGSLRPAEEQDAEDSDFVAVEIEGLLKTMLILGDAAVRGADGTDQGLAVEGVEGLADGSFVEVHDGIAVRFLVAGVEEGVER